MFLILNSPVCSFDFIIAISRVLLSSLQNRCPCGGGYLAKHPDEKRPPTVEEGGQGGDRQTQQAGANPPHSPGDNGAAAAPPASEAGRGGVGEPDRRVLTRVLHDPNEQDMDDQERIRAEKMRARVLQVIIIGPTARDRACTSSTPFPRTISLTFDCMCPVSISFVYINLMLQLDTLCTIAQAQEAEKRRQLKHQQEERLRLQKAEQRRERELQRLSNGDAGKGGRAGRGPLGAESAEDIAGQGDVLGRNGEFPADDSFDLPEALEQVCEPAEYSGA